MIKRLYLLVHTKASIWPVLVKWSHGITHLGIVWRLMSRRHVLTIYRFLEIRLLVLYHILHLWILILIILLIKHLISYELRLGTERTECFSTIWLWRRGLWNDSRWCRIEGVTHFLSVTYLIIQAHLLRCTTHLLLGLISLMYRKLSINGWILKMLLLTLRLQSWVILIVAIEIWQDDVIWSHWGRLNSSTKKSTWGIIGAPKGRQAALFLFVRV